MSNNIAQIMSDMKQHNGWKYITERLDEMVNEYSGFLTGDSIPTTITKDFNEPVYTKYDLLRITRKMLKDVKDIPDWIINKEDPVKTIDRYQDM